MRLKRSNRELIKWSSSKRILDRKFIFKDLIKSFFIKIGGFSAEFFSNKTAMTRRHKYTLLLVAVVGIVAVYIYSNTDKHSQTAFIFQKLYFRDAQDERKCLALFTKLRHPNQTLMFRPPLKSPPADMLNDFQQNGDMPITRDFYFNDVYSSADKASDQVTNETIPVIASSEVNSWRVKVRAREALVYGDQLLRDLVLANKTTFAQKKVLVLGTIDPWAEAIALEAGAGRITTVDYTRKRYENANMEWLHVNDYLDLLIRRTKETCEFDIAISFSSIEHSGLGRYGDPLSPYGDVDAVQQVHCLLKPGGLFYLGLPTSDDGSSYIEFNAHRVYGDKRLALLFEGWKVLFDKKSNDKIHSVFILKKLN